MKRLAAFILLSASLAFAQGIRLGDAQNITKVIRVPGVGTNILAAVDSATINFCTYPANAVPCTNKTTTYTDTTLATACDSSTQVVLSGSSTCGTTTDSQGNWGVYVAAGSYDYTVTISGTSYGPYFIGGITSAGSFTASGDLSGDSTSQVVIGVRGQSFQANLPTNGEFWRYNSGWQHTTLTSPDVPDLDAAKTTTGAFAAARIPTNFTGINFTFGDITPTTVRTSSTGEAYLELDDNVTCTASPVTDPDNPSRATFHLCSQGGIPGFSIAGGAFVAVESRDKKNTANGYLGLNGSAKPDIANIVTSTTNCDASHAVKGDLSGCISTGGSAPGLNDVTSATAANTATANADFAQVHNWKLTTNGKKAWTFGETTASTADATSSLLYVATLATSLINPFKVCAAGTSNCISINKDGLASAIGTAGFDATKLIGVVPIANGGTGTASTLTGLVRGNASAMTAAELSGDVTTSGSNATTIANLAVTTAKINANAVTSAKLAIVNTRRTCTMVVGATNGSVLADADIGPQNDQCFIAMAATIVEVTVTADTGTPTALPRRIRAGAATNLLSGALATAAAGAIACSNTGGTTGLDATTTCGSTLTTTALAAGDFLGLTSGVAGGAAHRMTIAVTYTIN